MTQLKSGSGCGISGWDYPDYPRVCRIEERQKGGPCVQPAQSLDAPSTQANLWLPRKDNETFQGQNRPEPKRLTWWLPPSGCKQDIVRDSLCTLSGIGITVPFYKGGFGETERYVDFPNLNGY